MSAKYRELFPFGCSCSRGGSAAFCECRALDAHPSPAEACNESDETDELAARSLTELILAHDLAELASREPLAPFAPWATEMARNLFARDIQENP